MKNNFNEYLDFQDILIKPSASTKFQSRQDVNIFNEQGHVPVCAANMEGVGTLDLAMVLQDADMLTFIDKKVPLEDWANHRMLSWRHVVPTFGISAIDIQNFMDFKDAYEDHLDTYGNLIEYICIDVANGHMEHVLAVYELFKEFLPDVKFIVGNIANAETMGAYDAAGIYACKVGIGSGKHCITRNVTGIGVPQVTLIQDMVLHKDNNDMDIKIISDGGIREIGDIVKALVIGADYVMCGSMFAGYDEGGMVNGADGTITFKGSSAIQTKDYVTPEGRITVMDSKGSVIDIVNDICGGLRSAGSYLGSNLKDFHTHSNQIITVRRQVNH